MDGQGSFVCPVALLTQRINQHISREGLLKRVGCRRTHTTHIPISAAAYEDVRPPYQVHVHVQASRRSLLRGGERGPWLGGLPSRQWAPSGHQGGHAAGSLGHRGGFGPLQECAPRLMIIIINLHWQVGSQIDCLLD